MGHTHKDSIARWEESTGQIMSPASKRRYVAAAKRQEELWRRLSKYVGKRQKRK